MIRMKKNETFKRKKNDEGIFLPILEEYYHKINDPGKEYKNKLLQIKIKTQ